MRCMESICITKHFINVICSYEINSKMNNEQSSYCTLSIFGYLLSKLYTTIFNLIFFPACHVKVSTTFIQIRKILRWDLSRNGRNCSLGPGVHRKFFFRFYEKANKLAIMTIAQCSSCYFITAKHSFTSLFIQIKGFIFIIYKYCNNSFLAILYVNILSLFLLIVGMKKLHNILFHQYLVIGFLSVKLQSLVWQNHRWYAVTGPNL